MACSTTKRNTQAAPLNYIDLSGDQYETWEEDQYWTVLTRKEPHYPIDAARERISGCVKLIVGINSEGKMQGYKIESSYPEKVFDKAAASSLAKWTWQATKKNSALQPILTTINLNFSVEGSSYDPKYKENCLHS